MNKDIEDLKTRLRDDAVRAAEAERALGLIEDVARSISNVGLLKPKLVVADGEVMLCVQLEDRDDQVFGEVANLAMVDPVDICGCDVVADLSDDEIGVAWNMLEDGATDQQIADHLKRPLDQFQDRLVEMRQELECSAASAVVDADDQPPAPEPEPEKQDAPAPAAKKYATEAVLAQMENLWAQDVSIAEIAEAVDAPNPKWVSNVINRNRHRFPKRKKPKTAKPKTPKLKADKATPPPEQAPAVRSIVPSPGARIHFTPDQDLKLAIHMQEGAGIGGAAALLRIKRDLCQARWNELLPEKTPQAIEALIKRLQKKLKSKAA